VTNLTTSSGRPLHSARTVVIIKTVEPTKLDCLRNEPRPDRLPGERTSIREACVGPVITPALNPAPYSQPKGKVCDAIVQL
jgi:hypothetical protein